MSASTSTLPAMPESNCPTKSSKPKLTYTEALSRYLVTEQGVYQVAACPPALFARFIGTCLWASPKKTQARQECLLELVGLDYADDPDQLSRWYAIDSLLSYGFTVALFASVEDAEASQKRCG